MTFRYLLLNITTERDGYYERAKVDILGVSGTVLGLSDRKPRIQGQGTDAVASSRPNQGKGWPQIKNNL